MNVCMGSLYVFTLWSPGSLSSSALSYESTSLNYESWSDDDIHEEDDKNLRHDGGMSSAGVYCQQFTMLVTVTMTILGRYMYTVIVYP